MRDSLMRNFDVTPRWVDDQARDTFENARNSARILGAAGVHRVILITLSTHMWRSTHEFAAAGMDVVPAPEGMVSSRGHAQILLQFIPSAEALTYGSLAVYELLGEPVRIFFEATHIRRHDT